MYIILLLYLFWGDSGGNLGNLQYNILKLSTHVLLFSH